MNREQKAELNRFFVITFNRILAMEERFMTNEHSLSVSVREMHILETVLELSTTAPPTMSQTAERLSITIGALTTAINVLVQKGYVSRFSDTKDRRIVRLELTELGVKGEKIHRAFHKRMVESIGQCLSDAEVEILIQSLHTLSAFFLENSQFITQGDKNDKDSTLF